MDVAQYHIKFKTLQICVLIPTYNNPKTLPRVLDGVLKFTENIIVINDGSAKETSEILDKYPQIEKIHLPKNRGKGNALKVGFKYAISLGYRFTITLDSDGQHFPSDIPIFIDALEASKEKDILLIGDRNMNEAEVLLSSRKGNRISGYWVEQVIDKRLNDSQSGFRLYPIKTLDGIRFAKNTRKFEFEVEVIVKAHWAGIDIRHVPINVLYDQEERVSHFRPFKDIARIVVLITWFLIVKLFYIRPRNFYRDIRTKGIKKFISEDIFGSNDSPKKKALSVALGLFIGFSPLWGFHTITVIALAIFLKLNKVIAFAFSNISIVPFIPFVLLASFSAGYWILGEENTLTIENFTQNFDIWNSLGVYLLGSAILSIGSAIILGGISYFCFLFFDKKEKIDFSSEK